MMPCSPTETYQDTLGFSPTLAGSSSKLARWAPAPQHLGIHSGYPPSASLLPRFHLLYITLPITQLFARCHKKQKQHGAPHKCFIEISMQSALAGITNYIKMLFPVPHFASLYEYYSTDKIIIVRRYNVERLFP